MIAEWGPTSDEKMIINLPTTVEAFPPNVYADRLEWFQRHISSRDQIILSVHPHNDRGTAVATAELGLMAGAERVEGTLFGNGERTGNVDIVTLALNLLTQGVDPGLDLSRIDEAQGDRRGVQRAAGPSAASVRRRARLHGLLRLAPGRDQEGHVRAAALGLRALGRAVPAVDPMDVGRNYEAIIRVNSQSGKGGVAYLMETEHHLELPRGLQVDFAQKVQAITDARGDELTADELLAAFHEHYLAHTRPYELLSLHARERRGGPDRRPDDRRRRAAGAARERQRADRGARRGFERQFGITVRIRDYHEHAMAASAVATAAAYVEADVDDDAVWGVGLHPSIATASLPAIVNAVNRAIALREAVGDGERALRRVVAQIGASRRRRVSSAGR